MTNKRKKISDEQLAEAVANSFSISAALRLLGLNVHSGIHGHYTRRARELNLPMDHFKRGLSVSGFTTRKTPEQVLREKPRGALRTDAAILRRCMIEVDIPHSCQKCGQGPNWIGEPLVLHADHINGNRNDDRRENLRFLCPNCHTQTNTWGSRNGYVDRRCSNCDKIIGKYGKTGLCKSCIAVARGFGGQSLMSRGHKIEWPEKEVLLEMLAQSNYTQVGKKLGVSDNAVRKHLNNNRD